MSSSRFRNWSRREASWLDREPTLRDGLMLARSRFLGGLRRPLVVLALAASTALGVHVVRTTIGVEHAPRYVLRVVEPNVDPTMLPPARRQLGEYVRDGVFTREVVLGIIDRQGLYPALRKNDAPRAVESFREDFEVEVEQNYFLEPRAQGDSPRSARLTLSFHSKDPDVALAVTRELGRIVVEREQMARERQAASALAYAEANLARAEHALDERRATISAERAHLLEATVPEPLREVRLVSLLGSLGWRQRELERAQTRKVSLEMGSEREASLLGLSFEVVDSGSIPAREQHGQRRSARIALISFVVALPAAALFAGAFSRSGGAA